MGSAVFLAQEEKEALCAAMTKYLVELRGRLGKTQEEMENASGISRVTLSQIESGRAKMSWLHFASLMQMFSQNQECKELLYVRGILNDRLLSFFQRGASGVYDYNVVVPEDRVYILAKLKTGDGKDEDSIY